MNSFCVKILRYISLSNECKAMQKYLLKNFSSIIYQTLVVYLRDYEMILTPVSATMSREKYLVISILVSDSIILQSTSHQRELIIKVSIYRVGKLKLY